PARKSPTTPPPMPGARPVVSKPPPTPAMGVKQVATAQTDLLPPGAGAVGPGAPTAPARRPITPPPPVPGGNRKTMLQPGQAFPRGGGNRSPANWASEGTPASPDDGDGPSFGGRLAAIPDEPAFAATRAGKVRADPADERGFETGKVNRIDDDDDLMPGRRGSSAGQWIAIVALLVMGAAAGVIYVVSNKQGDSKQASKPPADAAQVALAPDAQTSVTPIVDAAPSVPVDPLDAARAELAKNDEGRI